MMSRPIAASGMRNHLARPPPQLQRIAWTKELEKIQKRHMIGKKPLDALTLHGVLTISSRVEAPITNHLRDFALDLERYKAVQFFSV